jgi:threonine dehydrogenase-like Zn-dependent dehydrogenase
MIIGGVQLHGGNKLPITGSHEGVGVIERLGPDVDPLRFKVGDRVGTLNYYHPCGKLLRWLIEVYARTASTTMKDTSTVNRINRR